MWAGQGRQGLVGAQGREEGRDPEGGGRHQVVFIREAA